MFTAQYKGREGFRSQHSRPSLFQVVSSVAAPGISLICDIGDKRDELQQKEVAGLKMLANCLDRACYRCTQKEGSLRCPLTLMLELCT